MTTIKYVGRDVVITICLTGLVLILAGALPSAAQTGQPTIMVITKFQLPSDLCDDPAWCRLITHANTNGYVFVTNRDTGRLLVFQPYGQSYVQYTLPSTIIPVLDFAPFDTSVIMFGGTPFGLNKYDLQTQTATHISPNPNMHLLECTHNILEPQAAIYRIGTSNSVLVCSLEFGPVEGPDEYHLTTIDTVTLAATNILSVPGPKDGYRPWSVIVAGQDGQIYVDSLAQRYDSQTAQWFDVPMPGLTHDAGRLMVVDRASNLYFRDFTRQGIAQFTKVAPSG